MVWKLHREQQWSTTDGWRGIAIHVTVAGATRRELHLEYPAMKTQKIGIIRTDRVVINIRPAKVREHINGAMHSGWDPSSRGKPYVYDVGELPS